MMDPLGFFVGLFNPNTQTYWVGVAVTFGVLIFITGFWRQKGLNNEGAFYAALLSAALAAFWPFIVPVVGALGASYGCYTLGRVTGGWKPAPRISRDEYR